MSLFKKQNPLHKNLHHASKVLGVVLVWRGVWVLLDLLDQTLFGGIHVWSAIVGIIFGVIVLYVPDKKIEEII